LREREREKLGDLGLDDERVILKLKAKGDANFIHAWKAF
jgi:hypothetical protein